MNFILFPGDLAFGVYFFEPLPYNKIGTMEYTLKVNCEAIQYDGKNTEQLKELIKGSCYSIVGKDELTRQGELIEFIEIGEWLVHYENGFVDIVDDESFQTMVTR
jgi:hypothetical protein